jgi:hypothetical protein
MFRLLKHILTTAAVIAAISSSVAQARLELNPPSSSDASAPAQTAVAPPVQRTQSSPSQGFRWGDAGIGAAGVLVLLSIGSGAVLARQRRTRHPLAS